MMPYNLAMIFYDFCKNCNKCKPKIEEVQFSYAGTHHNIYCEHEDACKRMKEVLKKNNAN